MDATFATELRVGDAVEEGIGIAFGNGDVRFGENVCNFSGHIVGEAGGDVLVDGVIVHALCVDAAEGGAGVDLEGLPGLEACGDLVGEDGGVAGGVEDFLGDLSGDLVLAVAVGGCADEDGGDDERAIEADGADGIVEDALVAPLGEGFFLGFGEAEVDLGAEELIDAHVAVGDEEFLGADEAECIFEVGGHEVLAAFAAVEGEGGDARALAAGEIGEHAVVLVVGVGDDEHKGGSGAKLAEELLEGGGAVVEGKRVGEVLRRDVFAGEVGGVLKLGGWLGGSCQREGEGDCEQGGRPEGAKEVRSHAMVVSGLLGDSMVWSGQRLNREILTLGRNDGGEQATAK